VRNCFSYLHEGLLATNQVISECEDENDEPLSTITVSDWFPYICIIQLHALVRDSESQTGENSTIEVETLKFGKQKNHRGQLANGQCMVGGFCHELVKFL
jgi:hypothetical protein